MIRYRNTQRKSLEVRAWMLRNRLTNKALAEKVGVSAALVGNCIAGWNNNRRVLQGLVDAGCPKKFLALPEDMKGRRVA